MESGGDDLEMRVSRSVLIARPAAEVFAYVAEPLNDPDWCPKVLSVEQIEGDVPGPGARYRVIHRPIPVRPPREMAYVCVSSLAPSTLEWREDDGSDTVTVTYSLEDLGNQTRMIQQSDAELGAPRVLHPLMRIGIGHDIERQLKALERKLA
jgi:Polyketide cyclase / dehydrase and lipid transport